jgi:microcompartment protein CcmL/EutN
MGDVPTWDAGISKFTMGAPTGGSGGFDLTAAGNTAGALALISTGTMTLAGGANITLSQGGNGLTIVGGPGSAAETQTAISGIAGSNATFTSGTVVFTGSGGGVTVQTGTGQRVIISVAAQTNQTANVIDLTLGGNTAGVLALASSGTVTLAGGNNITLSQNGNAITISGASQSSFSQSVQPETQTFIGGISASNTLYTSGTVRLTGVGGGVTVSSNTGQRVDISVAAPVAQTIQTQNVVDLTLSGNTAGALALVSSGTATLAGGANITLSQAGNAISIKGEPAFAGTAISGIANSQTTYTSGTVSLSEQGAITIRSTTGNQFQFSVNPQSVQPETQTFIAGVSASNTLYTSGNVRITGSGAVTVRSGTGQQVVIDAPVQSVQAETQTFLSGIRASDTTYTSGNVTITGVGGGVTVNSNTGQRIDISVAAPVAQTVQTQNVVDLTLSGNTAGVLALVSSGTLTLAGGNNITVSQAGNAVTISGPNVGGAQTGISGIANSQTTYTSGTVSLSELGAITIRSTTGNQFQFSVNPQSVQPETQTFIGGVGNSETTYTSGTVNLSAVGGPLTIRSTTGNAFQFSVANQSVQPETQTFIAGISASDTLYTSGNVRITGVGGGVTISSNTGQRIDISVAAQSVQPETQTFIAGVSASDTLYTSGNVRFTGVGGGITVSSNTGQRVDLSVAAPVAQTVQAGSVYASSNTFGTSSGTYDARTLSIAGSGGVSVAASNSGWVISAPVSVAQTNQAGSVYAISNTSGTSSGTYDARTLSIAGAGIVTVAASNSGWRINASQSVQAGSVYASSNTFGTSSGTYDARSLSIAGRGAVSVAASNSGWIISAPVQSVQAETQTFVGGLANSQTTYTSGTVSFSEQGNLTIRSTTGNQFQFSVAPQSVQVETQTFVGGVGNSETTYTSGTVNLSAVGGPITIRSTTGNAFQFSVSQSVQPETQTFIAGISASDTLYTSGNVRFTGVGGGITVSSNTGQRVDLSVAAPVAQTNQSGNVYASSNTFGTSSGTYDARSLSIAGAGIVSVAASNSGWVISASAAQTNQSGNVYASSNTFGTSSGTYDARSISIAGRGAVSVAASNSGWIISAPVQSVQAETQTFVGGLANSQTTYTSGTVSFSELGNLTIRSTTGNQFQFSVAPQSVQAETQTFIGGIRNSETTYTSGTVNLSAVGGPITIRSTTGNAFQFSVSQSVQPETQTFLGAIGNSETTYTSGTVNLSVVGGNLTIRSTTGNAFQFSASQSVQAETQTAISGIANSQTTYTSGTVSLSELGAITIRSTTGNQFQFSVNSQTVQTQNVVDVTLSGNTAGAMALVSSGTLTLAGGNNITLSQAGNAVTISGAAGAQTGISGIANSQTTYTSGTVSFSEMGNLTIRSTTGNQFQFSVAPQSVQAETQTFLSGIRASDTTYTSGNVTITGVGGGVTVNSNTGQRVDISVAAPVAQTNQAGTVFAASNTFGTSSGTYDARTLSIAGDGIVSVAASNSGWRISATTAAQTNQSGNVYASSNTFGTSSGTYDARSLSIAGRGAVSVAASNSGWIISAPAQTAQTGISALSNSNTTYTSGTVGLSELGAITIRSTTGNQFQFSVNSQTVQTQNIMNVTLSGNSTSAGAGYVLISTGTMALAGGPNITLSQNGNTISISGPAAGAGGGVMIAGSNTTYTSGTVTFSGVGGGITVSSNTGQRIDLSVAAPVAQTNQAGSLYAISNTSGTSSGTYDARTLSIAGNGPITVAASNSGFRIDAPATSSLSGTGGIVISTNGSTISLGFANPLADWENMAVGNATLATHVSAISKTPFYWNDHLDGNLTAKSLAIRVSLVTASQPLSVSVHLGVYSFVNSTSAARLGSISEAFVVSSASSVSLSGIRNLILTGIGTHATLSTMSDGEYLFGMMFSATATNAMNFSLIGAGTAGAGLGGIYPGTNQLSTGISQGVQVLAGRGSTTVNAMPAAVSAADLINQGAGASMPLHPYVYIRS